MIKSRRNCLPESNHLINFGQTCLPSFASLDSECLRDRFKKGCKCSIHCAKFHSICLYTYTLHSHAFETTNVELVSALVSIKFSLSLLFSCL